MRSVLISLFGVVLMCLFSVGMFTASDLFSLWLIMELSVVSLVPCFFSSFSGGVYLPLFSYVLVSSLASALIVGGLMVEGCFFLCYVGLMMKFGVFPFMGWVYLVFVESNWLVVWCLSSLGKVPLLAVFFYFGLAAGSLVLVSFLSGVTLVVVSFLFWIYTFSWKHYWCHVTVSSSAILFLLAGSNVSFEGLMGVFVVYFIWCSFCVGFLRDFSFDSVFSAPSTYFFFCVIVASPLSISVFYKIWMCLNVFSCGFWVLLVWLICSFSEQFYLLKCLFSGVISFQDWGGSDYV